jgi:site-specific recombinase XerD
MKLQPIERYFRRGAYRARLRASVLAPYWNDFVEEMEGRGYRRYTTYRTVEVSLALAEHATKRGLHDTASLTDEFVAKYIRRRRSPRDAPRYLGHMVRFLRSRGAVPTPGARPAQAPCPLAEEYARFLRDHRGIGEKTIGRRRADVSAFLESLGKEGTAATISSLSPDAVHAFVMARPEKLARSSKKTLCAALRMFLRFLLLRGYLARDIVSSVPVIPSYKLDRLPRGIAWEDIQKILAVVDRTTVVGRRDYAIFLMLATYGIRVGQLCAMTLDDIDWRRQTIRVRAAKGGRDTVLPLRRSVGEALVAYLRDGRASSCHREIFLRVRAPLAPLRAALTAQIRPYARRAGVNPPYGTHAWRHACATRMLAGGQSLKTIRDVLGHISIESTFIYTKVDVETVRQAALEWPMGAA